MQGCRGHRPGRPALIHPGRLAGEEVGGRGRVRVVMADAVARVIARALADGEGIAGAVADVAELGSDVDLEDAACTQRCLHQLAQGCVGALAHQVIAGRGIGQGASRKGNKELHIEVAGRAVAGAEIALVRNGDQVEVGRLVPFLARIPAFQPVVLLQEAQQRHQAAIGF